MTNDSFQERLEEAVASAASDQTYLNNWAQLRSKHLLAAIAPGSIATIDYSYSAPQLVRRTTAVLQRAMLRARSDGSKDPTINDGLRRAAEVFEYLADLGEGPEQGTSALLSGALYQLAGYAANSMCIASRLSLPPAIDSPSFDAASQLLDRGVGLVLRRQFVRLRSETTRTVHSLRASENAFIQLLNEEEAPPEAAAALPAAVLAATVLDELAAHTLLGTSIDPFLETARDLRQVLLAMGDATALLKADALTAIGTRIAQTSIWTTLRERIDQDGLWRRYAMLSSRGRSRNSLEGRSGVELWESQLAALRAGLLSAESNGLAIRMPTSAGKTRIAELAILDSLAEKRRRQAVYVAPFNALADEIEASMAALFSDLGFRVSSVLGSYDLDDLEDDLLSSADLIITTPEKLTLLLRSRPDHFESVGLLVLDEGHIIDSKDRGIGYELLLSRLRQSMPSDSRIVFLSAVISDENAADFAEWLCDSRDAVAASDWRPARQRVGIYNAAANRIDYPREEGVGGFQSQFVLGIIQRGEYTDFTEKLRHEKQVSFPSNSKGDLTAELCLKFVSEGPVVVFTTQPRWAESCAEVIARALQLRRQTQGSDIPAPFREVKDRGYPPSSVAVAESWLGPDSKIVRALRDGIGIHHGGMPEAVRRAVENDFRAGLLPVIAATGTLGQGVNLPVKTVLIHTLHQYDADAEQGDDQRLSLLDFWNTAGRAGRAGAESEGHIIVVTQNNWQAAQARKYLLTQPEPIRGRLFELLASLTEQRLSHEDFRAQLDSDLLTTLVEESVGSGAEARFQELIEGSFVSIQTRNLNESTDLLVESAANALSEIRSEVPEDGQRQAFALTGLDVATCRTIEERVVAAGDEMRLLLTGPDARPEEFVRVMHSLVSDLQTFTPRYDFVGDIDELIGAWIDQKPMRDIVLEYLPDGSDESQFQKNLIADYFGYKLPWAISSVIKIASNALNLEGQISDTAQWAAPMARYGVATPKAAWAMTLGCPTRELASGIADAFAHDQAAGSYREFVGWFSRRTAEDFILGMGASPDEARLLVPRAAALVPDGREFAQLLRAEASAFDADVAGLEYESRSARLSAVSVGNTVALTRDYGDPYDVNAIRVEHVSGDLGFVPRHLARLIAPQIDSGATYSAVITVLERGTASRVRLRIELQGVAEAVN